MKTDLFYDCKTVNKVEQRYQELSRVFKNNDEMLIVIKDEYSALMNVLNPSKPVEAYKEKATVPEKADETVKTKATVSEKIRELQGKIDPAGLHLEICGTWLWVTGKTFQVKDVLKELGFRYSANKLSWYYRQEEHRSPNQEPIPLEMIREKFGSQQVELR